MTGIWQHTARLRKPAVADWLTDIMPAWLVTAMRPRRAPVPWGEMLRAAIAIWVPLAAGIASGQRLLGLLIAMGGLLGIVVDNGGAYAQRLRRVSSAAVFGGAAGLAISSLIHGRGWIAVVALVVVAGVSALLSAISDVGSVTGLQLLVYSSLGLGPLGALRPWWHTALGFVLGTVWALILTVPGWLLSPRGAERRSVAAVYHALAGEFRAAGTPGFAEARRAATAAMNTAYDTLLTARSTAGGRNERLMRLVAMLNQANLIAEAATALSLEGNRPPPAAIETLDEVDGRAQPAGPGPGRLPDRTALRRQARRAISDLRAEFERTMSEPQAISRQATAWWPAVVGLDEVMDAVTATAVAVDHGAPAPSPDAAELDGRAANEIRTDR